MNKFYNICKIFNVKNSIKIFINLFINFFVNHFFNIFVKNMEVGDKIRYLLEQNGSTQADLARGIGKTPFYVHNLLKRKTMDCGVLAAVAHFLNVSVTYFFEDGGNTEDAKSMSAPKYIGNCKSCRDKDQVISALKENIVSLKKVIRLLEQKDGTKGVTIDENVENH